MEDEEEDEEAEVDEEGSEDEEDWVDPWWLLVYDLGEVVVANRKESEVLMLISDSCVGGAAECEGREEEFEDPDMY